MPLVFHQRQALLWALGFVSVALSASPPATPLLIAMLAITAITLAGARPEPALATIPARRLCPPAHTGTRQRGTIEGQ